MANNGIWGLYARVSSERQVEEGISIESQLATLREFARQKGYTPREFVDAGKSAWTEDLEKRPQFKVMLDAAHAGELDGIIVTHLDRFSRKLIVTLSVLGELGRRSVGFISLENAAFDFSRPTDRLLLSVLGAFSQYYSDELSRKIQRGIGTRAHKGLLVGTLPFGYCNGRCIDCKSQDETKPSACPRWGTLTKDAPAILHPDDAPGGILAFETYQTAKASHNDVADVLNAAGYRSRSPRGRVLWNEHSVAELLRNVAYTGVVTYKGQELPGQHPAIISRELFDQVQAIKRKRKNHQATFNQKYRVYLFGGILRCAGCGRVMRAQTRIDRELPYYRCMSRELRLHHCPMTSTSIYEDILAEQFAAIVSQFQLPKDWRARVSELVNGNGKQQTRETDKRTLTERLERLKKQFEWGDIGEREYIAKRDEIRHALAECEPPVATIIINAAEYLQNMARVWDAATPVERRDMTRAILEDVVGDPETKQLVALRPKPAFHLLFRQIRGLVERNGAFEITTGVGV